MLVVIICSFIALLLTYLESRGILKRGMLCGFIIITVLGCIHYNYGNDYEQYFSWFYQNSDADITIDSLFGGFFLWEPGWVILNHVFNPFGFFALVAFVNIVINILYYRVIYKFVDKKWRLLAFSIYLLSTSLYVLNFSMMRQGLAVAIFLASWPLIKKGSILRYFLVILICASFHKSALVLLPLVLLGKIIKYDGKLIAFIMAGLFLSFYLSATLIPDIFETITSWDYFFAQDSLDYYENDEVLERHYGVGFIVNLIPFIVGEVLLLRKQNEPDVNILIVLCQLAFMIAPFGSLLSMLIRITYYFVAYQVIAIPKMYSMISSIKVRYGLVALFFLMLLYGYFGFFNSPTYSKSYSVFHTIFEAM